VCKSKKGGKKQTRKCAPVKIFFFFLSFCEFDSRPVVFRGERVAAFQISKGKEEEEETTYFFLKKKKKKKNRNDVKVEGCFLAVESMDRLIRVEKVNNPMGRATMSCSTSILFSLF
jgi:hypothetical protein